MNDLALWQSRFEEFWTARPVADNTHDIHHLRRVWRIAARLAEQEGGADLLVILAAAYLHDIVNLPKDSPERPQASRMAAAEAVKILRAMGFSESRLDAVNHAIAAHSFTAGVPPQSLEARILQDADRLDALGAIGLARCFHIGGQLQRALFDNDDPLAHHRAPDDARFVLDHLKIKLLKLPEIMQTRAGREMAMERAAFITAFQNQIEGELLGTL